MSTQKQETEAERAAAEKQAAEAERLAADKKAAAAKADLQRLAAAKAAEDAKSDHVTLRKGEETVKACRPTTITRLKSEGWKPVEDSKGGKA